DGLVRQEQPWRRRLIALFTQRRRVPIAADAVPVADADQVAAGFRVPYFQEWLEHDGPADPWWAPLDFRPGLGHAAPATLVAGWWDIFAPSQLRDFEQLVAAGRDVRIRVGPWTHTKAGGAGAFVRDSYEWMDIHLRGALRAGDDKVRLWVIGANQWKTFASWPPASASQTHFLHAGGRLTA